jgi:DNA-binding MarR family transcriptional regulator
MERTTLTRNLKLLEKDGLITTRAGAHHRSRVAELTASGRTRLEQAYPLWQAVQAEYRECLGSEGWRESHGALTRLATVDR